MPDLARMMRSPFARAGVPMILFVVAGSVGLSYFVEGKHDIDKTTKGKRSLTLREYDLEEDYKKTMHKLVKNDYALVPIKRPE